MAGSDLLGGRSPTEFTRIRMSTSPKRTSACEAENKSLFGEVGVGCDTGKLDRRASHTRLVGDCRNHWRLGDFLKVLDSILSCYCFGLRPTPQMSQIESAISSTSHQRYRSSLAASSTKAKALGKKRQRPMTTPTSTANCRAALNRGFMARQLSRPIPKVVRSWHRYRSHPPGPPAEIYRSIVPRSVDGGRRDSIGVPRREL